MISAWLKKTIILPAKKRIADFFHKIGYVFHSNADENETKPELWKTSALDNFKSWLDEMPVSKEAVRLDVTPDTCDLYTLFCEFTSLRQEIRMQNREQHRTLKALDSIGAVTSEYKDAFNLFKEKSQDLSELETRIRRNAERHVAANFFDLRDTLVRGYKASLEISGKKRFFRTSPKGMEQICQGYEMAIQRFDKAMANMDIYSVNTDDVMFNSETMKAVETQKIPGVEKGMVLENISGGFIQNNIVLRFAQVIVNN